jgi:hypothetical protein
MKQVLRANKPGLYNKLLTRLEEAGNSVRGASQKEYIPFPVVFEKICRGFSIKKSECWELLFMLDEFGLVQIIKFKGVKLNFSLKND